MRKKQQYEWNATWRGKKVKETLESVDTNHSFRRDYDATTHSWKKQRKLPLTPFGGPARNWKQLSNFPENDEKAEEEREEKEKRERERVHRG